MVKIGKGKYSYKHLTAWAHACGTQFDVKKNTHSSFNTIRTVGIVFSWKKCKLLVASVILEATLRFSHMTLDKLNTVPVNTAKRALL